MPSESPLALRDVSFSHVGAIEPLFAGLTVHFPTGFTGVVGANGAGKTSLLRLLVGDLAPSGGSVVRATDAVYCEQRTDTPPAGLSEFLDDWNGATAALRGRLGIEADFLARWERLSHGERKRAQIGHALWRRPSLLAIDEPTNHIDAAARSLLMSSLQNFHGVGLLVSHDRELLDALCVQCVWLERGRARVYPGGYSDASEQRAIDDETAARAHDRARREQRRLERELVRRREHASREHRSRSKRGLDRKDSDAREKIDRARVSDGKSGQPLRQLAGRAEHARQAAEELPTLKSYATGIWLPGARARSRHLFIIDAGELPLDGHRRLRFPRLSMRPDDRIALTGVNGSGKSSLVRHLVASAGVPSERLVYLPQEIPAAAARDVLTATRSLRRESLGHVLNIVSRLGSRPERLLDSRQPSPGEVRKLLLALGMAKEPHLIVMDEPTNHLDLPSIEALEEALADCPCGLLLVSHDERFLEGLATIRWQLECDGPDGSSLSIS